MADDSPRQTVCLPLLSLPCRASQRPPLARGSMPNAGPNDGLLLPLSSVTAPHSPSPRFSSPFSNGGNGRRQ